MPAVISVAKPLLVFAHILPQLLHSTPACSILSTLLQRTQFSNIDFPGTVLQLLVNTTAFLSEKEVYYLTCSPCLHIRYLSHHPVAFRYFVISSVFPIIECIFDCSSPLLVSSFLPICFNKFSKSKPVCLFPFPILFRMACL